MIRFLIALAVSLSLTVAAHAAGLPTGTWTVNAGGTKGELVISEIDKDGKVTGKFHGDKVTGTWKKGVFTLNDVAGSVEARLVTEPAGTGKIKCTLTGTRTVVNFFPVSPEDTGEEKSGWYAQIIIDAPPAPAPVPMGAIKAEVRGALVYEDIGKAYVSVKRDNGFGRVEETRIWVHASEGEWKGLKQSLPPLNGKEVIVTAQLGQMKGDGASLPNGTLYFLGRFEPKLANVPK